MKILKYALGAGILLLLFYNIGFSPILTILKSVHLRYTLLAVVLFILSVVIASVNIFLLIRPLKTFPLRHFLDYYFLSRVSSLFLPGRLGEFTIVYFLKKEEINVGKGIAAVVMDKWITFICSLLIGSIGIVLLLGGTVLKSVLVSVLILFVAGQLMTSTLGQKLLMRLLPQKYQQVLTDFSLTWSEYTQNHKRELLANIFLTISRMGIIALSAYYMFLAVGTIVDLRWVFLIGGTETVMTMIPFTINGLGVKQSVGVYLYALIGVDPAVTAARYVVGLLIQYGFGFISLLFVRGKKHETPD